MQYDPMFWFNRTEYEFAAWLNEHAWARPTFTVFAIGLFIISWLLTTSPSRRRV